MTTTAPQTGYAPVNGLELYYEIHGTGDPLILLHGGLSAVEMFGDVLPMLAKSRQVIAVDLQAHGRTADIDRPLSYEDMADDVAALIKHLALERADVMGYSLGGGVALRTAIQHPEVVKSSYSFLPPSSAVAGTPKFSRAWPRWVPRLPSP